MSRQKNTRPNGQQAKLIELLNRPLADAIDLQLQSRQSYWNVNGSHFIALRGLFDQDADTADLFTDIARGIDKGRSNNQVIVVCYHGKATDMLMAFS